MSIKLSLSPASTPSETSDAYSLPPDINRISYLEDNQSQIEYVDPLETEGFFISKSIYSIDKEYTHCEIHSSLILGA